MEAEYIVEGKPPKRIIYPPGDQFPGADPDHPETEFAEDIWEALKGFLKEQCPGKKNGRFGFAECLSCKGPPAIRKVYFAYFCFFSLFID